METPSSMRRVTRSQTTSLSSQKIKQEEVASRSRNGGKPGRAVLLDITNDSPIVGLATGQITEKTPSSNMTKNHGRPRQTPGSGEELLRGQVKTLLQKVEEETEVGNKLSSLGSRPPFSAMLGFSVSPAELLAPTPANTPQILNLSGIIEEEIPMGLVVSPFVANEVDQKTYPQVVEELKQKERLDCVECVINRALLFDSPGKSEASNVSPISSSLTYQESEASFSCPPLKSSEDDNSSAWSLQVNASIQEDEDGELEDSCEEDEGDYNGEVDDADDYEEEEEEEEEESVDELCQGLLKMSVGEGNVPEFAGKHTRFIYNSDDEIDGEEEVSMSFDAAKLVSPNVMVLKGLPVPEGKHLRFQDEEED